MLRLPKSPVVEVDMVPYIDIVTLLLMFLVIVGDMTRSANAVQMKLPKASQAEREIGVSTAGRIVIQMELTPTGMYHAKVENHPYSLGPDLSAYLRAQIERRVASQGMVLGAKGEVPFPVKLRIPASAPMCDVERLIGVCAKEGLVHIHYAAEPPEKTKLKL